jgi:WhiB family redox-sensing transcriptional regulator
MSHVLYEMGSQRWMLRGACRQVDPELFFPIAAKGPAERQVADAKAVCGPCSVRPDCLSFALEAMPEGIWGGTTREERRAGLRSSVPLSRLDAGNGPHPAGPHDAIAG